MDEKEIAIKNYEIVSQQLNTRARLRDNALLTYLTTSITIFGIVLGTSTKGLEVDPSAKAYPNAEVLLVIPYLALGISIIISHHNLLIGSFLDFLKKYESIKEVSKFYGSSHFDDYNSAALLLRTGGHIVIILMPCILALIINGKSLHTSSPPIVFIWWSASICTVIAAGILIWLFSVRKESSQKDSN